MSQRLTLYIQRPRPSPELRFDFVTLKRLFLAAIIERLLLCLAIVLIVHTMESLERRVSRDRFQLANVPVRFRALKEGKKGGLLEVTRDIVCGDGVDDMIPAGAFFVRMNSLHWSSYSDQIHVDAALKSSGLYNFEWKKNRIEFMKQEHEEFGRMMGEKQLRKHSRAIYLTSHVKLCDFALGLHFQTSFIYKIKQVQLHNIYNKCGDTGERFRVRITFTIDKVQQPHIDDH